MEVIIVSVVILFVLALGGWWLARDIKASAAPADLVGDKASLSVTQDGGVLSTREDPIELPSKIVVASGDEEVLSMTIIDEARLAALSNGVPKVDMAPFSRALEPIMLVAPSMATAAMAGSKQLMEVVINGNLVAAVDGNGFRAMAMGANGIKENARLFKPVNLQNVANAAAIWQLASVVVAQKHLADISETLKRVESKVDGIQSFMEEQRFAVIQSVMHYLGDARKALGQGEFLERTRDQLEVFDIELERASTSLVGQIRRESGMALEEDMVGCEGEYTSALRRHRQLKRYVEELTLCNEVRLTNWYLCLLSFIQN